MYLTPLLNHFTNKPIDKYIINKSFNDKGDLEIVQLHFSNEEESSKEQSSQEPKPPKIILGILGYILVKDEDKDTIRTFRMTPLKSCKDVFPIIMANVKNLFGIVSNFYNVVLVEEKPHLIQLYNNSIFLTEYMKGKENYLFNNYNFLNSIRKIIAFNYLMCVPFPVNSRFENNILVEPYHLNTNGGTCIKDTKNSTSVFYIYVNETLKVEKQYTKKFIDDEINVPKSIINRYFEKSDELFQKYVGDIARDIDTEKLRFELVKIVNLYNPDYIPWTNAVYNRFLSSKEMSLSIFEVEQRNFGTF